MLENIFILLCMAGLVMTIFAYYESKVFISALSVIVWIIIFANSLYIEVPGDTAYQEYGLNAFCLAFIFIGILMTISNYVNYMDENEYEDMFGRR